MDFDEYSGDYSGSESGYMETDQASIDADDFLQDLLKKLIDNKKEKVSPIERLHKKMEGYFPYVYKIGFGSSLTGESGGHTGTGFLLDAKEGIVLTNYHVVPGDDFGIISLQ